MPYIKQEGRSPLLNGDARPASAGDLNFLITETCLDFIESQGKSYTTINAVVGALECAKLELYRRLAAPYEDKKIAENGDITGYAIDSLVAGINPNNCHTEI